MKAFPYPRFMVPLPWRETALRISQRQLKMMDGEANAMSVYFHRMSTDNQNFSTCMSYNSLLVESRGHENITYNQTDVRNVVHLNRRKSQLEGDVVALEKYFQEQYEYNQEFYSAIERDDDGRLMNAFWADARSRAMHKDFGDIITFDTTFLCNRNRMPFAPLLPRYFRMRIRRLLWVFNQWLKCMGNPPKGILTDQCKSYWQGCGNYVCWGAP
ncbi:Protein FAR-RED IMPAIRED RESPONSE 1 [Bienertia sinuspersici]